MLISVSNSAKALCSELAGAFPYLEFQPVSDEQLHIESADPIHLSPLFRFIEDHNAEVTEARRLSPSLEDVFVRITGIEANTLRKETEKKGGVA